MPIEACSPHAPWRLANSPALAIALPNSPTEECTPQGGPFSPLLSNLMLDVPDKELEKPEPHSRCPHSSPGAT
jgi:hypothetical protein